jgi:hypothetical protein
MHDALVNLLEKPVSLQATKAASVTAYYLVTNNTTDRGHLPLRQARQVRLLVELLVDADKGTTEFALSALCRYARATRSVRGSTRPKRRCRWAEEALQVSCSDFSTGPQDFRVLYTTV